MPRRPALASALRLAGAIVLVALTTAAVAGRPSDASAAPLVVRPWKPWGFLIPPVDDRSPAPVTGRRPSSTHLDRPSDGPPERAAPPRERRDEDEEESEERDPPEPEPEVPDVDVGATPPGGPGGPQTEVTGGEAPATTAAATAAGDDGAPMALALIVAAATLATVSLAAVRAVRR